MKYIYILPFVLLFVLSCGTKGNKEADTAVEKEQSSTTEPKKSTELKGEIYPVRLDEEISGIGVLSYKGPEPFSEGTGSRIEILNLDGSIYCTISLEEGAITFDGGEVVQIDNTQRLSEEYHFNPRLFYPEYELLEFVVLNISESHYHISIGSVSDEKMVRKGGSQFDYHSWEDYIQTKYLSFDPKENPIRVAPDNDSEIVYAYNDYFFKAIEVQGDWIKIECNNDCKTCDKGKLTGWIKWKEGKKLLVSTGSVC